MYLQDIVGMFGHLVYLANKHAQATCLQRYHLMSGKPHLGKTYVGGLIPKLHVGFLLPIHVCCGSY